MKSRLTMLVLALFSVSAGPSFRTSLAREHLDRSSSTAVVARSLGRPKPDGLRLATRLPLQLPQRIMGLAFDGKKLWATVYLGHGAYATYDPSEQRWEISEEGLQENAIAKVAGAFQSPGAISFVNGKLWIAGAYGESFGAIDPETWKVEKLFKGKYRDVPYSQSYSSMAFDGSHVWIVWHWFEYRLPVSESQLLLKVDPDSGKVVDQFPLPPGTRSDGTHGLTWDGVQLWHAKDQRLSAIDPSNGSVTFEHKLTGVRRPSGLAWDGNALWISEFEGRIWHLAFQP